MQGNSGLGRGYSRLKRNEGRKKAYGDKQFEEKKINVENPEGGFRVDSNQVGLLVDVNRTRVDGLLTISECAYD